MLQQTTGLESTLFPVYSKPAYNKHGMFSMDKNTGYQFIVRQDTEEILSCMTDKYKIVTNNEIISTAKPILNEYGAKLKEAISFGSGQKTVWKWIIPDIQIEVDAGDLINPEIIIKNSYDGTLQVHILAGAFRLVCSNGMVIGLTLGSKNYKHNKGNNNLNHLNDAIINTIKYTKKVGDEFPLLKETPILHSHTDELIKKFPKKLHTTMEDYKTRRGIKNYWDLFNLGTWTTTHVMKRTQQTTHKLESQLYPMISEWAKS